MFVFQEVSLLGQEDDPQNILCNVEYTPSIAHLRGNIVPMTLNLTIYNPLINFEGKYYDSHYYSFYGT